MPLDMQKELELIPDISIRIGDEEITVTFGRSISQVDAVKRAFQILETFISTDDGLEVTEDLINDLVDVIQDSVQSAGNDSPVDRGDAEGLARAILDNSEIIAAIRK